MMSVTRVTALTMSPMVSPALSTSTEPISTRLTESSIRPLISFAACAALPVAHFTGHHREAAALLAGACRFHCGVQRRMLVWKAMPSITPVISAIFCELPAMSCMVCTTLATTLPPFCAVSEALNASCEA